MHVIQFMTSKKLSRPHNGNCNIPLTGNRYGKTPNYIIYNIKG
jgi:hypothetical protein